MPSKKKSRSHPRKSVHYQQKQPEKVSQATAGSVLTAGFVSSRHSPSSRANDDAYVEGIKNRAIRTEELTQRAHRFTYQLAIDLREILQAEFDALEKKSADPKSSVSELKTALIVLSTKMTSEIDKQMDVQKKIAEAYAVMYKEVSNMAKQVLTEIENAPLTMEETANATRHLNDVQHVIRESVDYWVARPDNSRKKLNDIRRDSPKDSMDLNEMYEHLESQMAHCHKAIEHPMAGAISISKEFAKLNIYRKL